MRTLLLWLIFLAKSILCGQALGDRENYYTQPILSLLTVFIHQKLQHLAPHGALLLESEDANIFSDDIVAALNVPFFDEFQAFLNGPRYAHVSFYFLKTTKSYSPYLKRILKHEELECMKRDVSCLEVVQFIRDCIRKFHVEATPSNIVSYIASQYYLLERPTDVVLAEIAPKLRLTMLAVLPLKNLVQHEALNLLLQVQYQIITLDDFEMNHLAYFTNYPRNPNGLRLVDFGSFDLVTHGTDAFFDALRNQGINGIIMHWTFESRFLCDHIVNILADDLQRLSISWDENVDFVGSMQNILTLKKLDFVGFYDASGRKENFYLVSGTLKSKGISLFIPTSDESSDMMVFGIENLLLEAAANNFVFFNAKEVTFQPILTLKERSLFISFILGRFYVIMEDFFQFTGDFQNDLQVNFSMYSRYFENLNLFLPEISSCLLAVEIYDLYFKIKMNHDDIFRHIFAIKKSYFSSKDVFVHLLKIVRASLQAVTDGMKQKKAPKDICDFDRIIATRHFLSAIKINEEEFLNEISSYLLLPSIFELNVWADWLRIPVRNFKPLEADHLIIYRSVKGQSFSNDEIKADFLTCKISVASSLLLNCAFKKAEKLLPLISLMNFVHEQTGFPTISGLMNVKSHRSALRIIKGTELLSLKTIHFYPLYRENDNFDFGPIAESFMEMQMNLVFLNHYSFLEAIYNYVVEKDGQVGIRCVVSCEHLFQLALNKGLVSPQELLTDCRFDHRILRFYSNDYSFDGLVIIDLGSARMHTKAKRAIH